MEEYKSFAIKKGIDELQLFITLSGYELVVEGHEGNEIIIETDDKEEAEKSLEVVMAGNELRIAEKSKISFNSFEGGELMLKFPVKKHYSGEIKTASGDIEITGISYDGNIQSASGDINLDSLKGTTDLQLITASGDIELENPEGKISVRSVSGDIEINNAILSSLNGNTVSGDFGFNGKLSSKEDSSIKTVSGDIEFNLKNSENLIIYSKTMSGDVDIEGSYSPVEKESSKDLQQLVLKTVSGDINVELDESCKNVYSETSKVERDFSINIGRLFDKTMHNDIHRTVEAVVKRVPRGVEVTERAETSNKEHISRILTMLEDGKINAGEAKELIDAL